LTNFSLNKKSDNFVKNTVADNDGEGSKWSHRAFRRFLRDQGIDDAAVFSQIEALAVKTLISIEHSVSLNLARHRATWNCAFELYGFDVMLDQDLQPWLIEVNVCPSLSSSSPLDKGIKYESPVLSIHRFIFTAESK